MTSAAVRARLRFDHGPAERRVQHKGVWFRRICGCKVELCTKHKSWSVLLSWPPMCNPLLHRLYGLLNTLNYVLILAGPILVALAGFSTFAGMVRAHRKQLEPDVACRGHYSQDN